MATRGQGVVSSPRPSDDATSTVAKGWAFGRGAEISMADGTENLMLEHLRHIRGAVEGLREDMRDLSSRAGHPEIDVAQIQVALAEHSVRFDRLEARVARTEKRLDLADA